MGARGTTTMCAPPNTVVLIVNRSRGPSSRMSTNRHPVAPPTLVMECRLPSSSRHLVTAYGTHVGVPGVATLLERGVALGAGSLYLVIAGGSRHCLGFQQVHHLLSVEVST
jgi:hypothetical protein